MENNVTMNYEQVQYVGMDCSIPTHHCQNPTEITFPGGKAAGF
jgi:hypothetical protein